MIPKTIHQTWINHDLQPEIKELVDTWIDYHPGWKYRLWSDEENRQFIKDYFPFFLSTYDRYPYNIQRADAIRYFILYRVGGVYIDLDVECLKPVDNLLLKRECLLCLEPDEHAVDHQVDEIISNAIMASAPGHSFFEAVIKELLRGEYESTVFASKKYYILNTTGPFMLKHVLDKYKEKHRISILPSCYFCPLTMMETRLLGDDKMDQEIEDKLKDAFAIHYFMGSWWKEV